MTYVTLTEGNAYFASRLRAEAWDQAPDTEKTKAIEMTEKIITRISFKGLQDTAELLFPRDVGFTPPRFSEAIFEEALSLLNGNDNEKDLADLHVKTTNLAGFSTTVNELTERPWILHGLTSPVAWNCLAPYVIDPRSVQLTRA